MSVLSSDTRAALLKKLADGEGFESIQAMLEHATFDSVAPGICINPDCDHTAECEPDARNNYCEGCGQQTLRSCLSLAGLV